MYATHIATYNRFVSTQNKAAEDILDLDYDELFSEEKLQQAEQNYSGFSNNDSEEAAREKFDAMLKQPIPVVRKTSIKNTQESLNQLQLSLTFAQLFAKTYWDGKEDFGPRDMLSLLFGNDEEKKEESDDI